MKIMHEKMKGRIACAVVVLAAAVGSSWSRAEEFVVPERILGQIILNETKLDDYLEGIRQRGCAIVRFSSAGEYSAAILPGCFNLVGHPTVLFETKGVVNVIDSVEFLFDDGRKRFLFDRYFDKLSKIYGRPDGYTRQHRGIFFARWNLDDMVVTLEWPPQSRTGSLTYSSIR